METTLTAEELKALKQLTRWIEGLELWGRVEGQEGYFDTASNLWAVFPAVAMLHGVSVNELVAMVRERV